MSEEAKKAEKATKEVVETAAKKTTKKEVVEAKVEETAKETVAPAKKAKKKAGAPAKEASKEEVVEVKAEKPAEKKADAPAKKVTKEEVAEVKAEEPVEKKAAPVKKARKKVEAKEEAPVVVTEDSNEDDETPLTVAEILEEEEEVSPENFDWDSFEYGMKSMSNDERTSLEKMYEETLSTSVEHEVVDGIVVQKSDRDVIIDIGGKSEGVISLNEFRYNPELKEGDSVEVLVDKQEDKTGQLVLSHRKARAMRAWERVNSAFETEEIV